MKFQKKRQNTPYLGGVPSPLTGGEGEKEKRASQQSRKLVEVEGGGGGEREKGKRSTGKRSRKTWEGELGRHRRERGKEVPEDEYHTNTLKKSSVARKSDRGRIRTAVIGD